MHVKTDSDVTSSVPSSPRSPKRPLYYVQSPSRDSHDGDKSSSIQATPAYNSPNESPSHPSYSRHSRASSASRFSGTLKKGRKRNDKGWPECDVIEEEGDYGEFYGRDKGLSRRCQVFMGVLGFVVVFSVFCLIIWGASRPYKAQIAVKVSAFLLIASLQLFLFSKYYFFNNFMIPRDPIEKNQSLIKWIIYCRIKFLFTFLVCLLHNTYASCKIGHLSYKTLGCLNIFNIHHLILSFPKSLRFDLQIPCVVSILHSILYKLVLPYPNESCSVAELGSS